MKFKIFYNKPKIFKENNQYDDEGQRLAMKYDLIYNGWWEDANKFTFTDKDTKSTFLANDEEELIKKLNKMKKSFTLA